MDHKISKLYQKNNKHLRKDASSSSFQNLLNKKQNYKLQHNKTKTANNSSVLPNIEKNKGIELLAYSFKSTIRSASNSPIRWHKRQTSPGSKSIVG